MRVISASSRASRLSAGSRARPRPGPWPRPAGRRTAGWTTAASAASSPLVPQWAPARRARTARIPPASASRPATARDSTAVTIRGNQPWSVCSESRSAWRARSAAVCGALAREVLAAQSSRARAAGAAGLRWPGDRRPRSPARPDQAAAGRSAGAAPGGPAGHARPVPATPAPGRTRTTPGWRPADRPAARPRRPAAAARVSRRGARPRCRC